ncbi:MAG: methyltransferase domain-containing protein [Gammaproteobacteria bacterium]|nr:methyltransferase domain-containing protein [Gammaproteobacteria bacterium]
MAAVSEHYDSLLGEIYSWFTGGFEENAKKNRAFFDKYNIHPRLGKRALDLGAGPGVQSIPLAQFGYEVTAIDTSEHLLGELRGHAEKLGLHIDIIHDDMLGFPEYVISPVELIVCMTDTIVHVESKELVTELFGKAYSALEKEGQFVLTFRDLSFELSELDRFIPLKSDDNRIFSCFLEYQQDSVKVHDLIYRKENDVWQFDKSFYHKLRLSVNWVEESLVNSGFRIRVSDSLKGFTHLIASK